MPFNPLAFPPNIVTGAAADYADRLSAISEAPWHFYAMSYLACLGHVLDGVVTASSLLHPRTGGYWLFLGQTGVSRKSFASGFTVDILKEAFPTMNIMDGLNSGEGLITHLKKHPRTILYQDEFLHLITKTKQKGNTICTVLTSLWERTSAQIATTQVQHRVTDAYLTMIGCCTLDTYSDCWTGELLDIGLANRMFILPGHPIKSVAIPPPLSEDDRANIMAGIEDTVDRATFVSEYPVSPEAAEWYEDWYHHRYDRSSPHSVRIDAYAIKFMLLFSINEGHEQVR